MGGGGGKAYLRGGAYLKFKLIGGGGACLRGGANLRISALENVFLLYSIYAIQYILLCNSLLIHSLL